MDFKIGDRTIYKSKFNKRESKIVEINGVIINGYQYIKIKHIDKSYSDEWVIKKYLSIDKGYYRDKKINDILGEV